MMLRSKVPGGAKVRQCAQIVARPFRAAVLRRCILAVGFGREGYKNSDGCIIQIQIQIASDADLSHHPQARALARTSAVRATAWQYPTTRSRRNSGIMNM